MALLFMDGFDCYASAAQAVDGGWNREDATNCTFSTTAGRFGGGSIGFLNTTHQWTRNIPVVAYGGTLFTAFAYYHTGSVAGPSLLRVVSDANALLVLISHSASGAITFTPNSGTATTEAGASLTPNTWHWVEIKIVLGTTASNGSCEIRIDGSTVINATSQDTNSSGSGAGFIELGAAAASGNEGHIDDVVIFDASGATFNTFIGDSKITTHTPNGDAATVDWTASAGADYECVDETPSAANDDTDYISSSTAGQESRFTMTNLSGTPDTVHAVQVRYRAKKTDAGTRTVRGLINSSATESTGNTAGLTTAYRWFFGDLFPLNPNGSVAWTPAAVNALEVGVEVVA